MGRRCPQAGRAGPSRVGRVAESPESRVALNKTESYNVASCCKLAVKGDKFSFTKVGVRVLRFSGNQKKIQQSWTHESVESAKQKSSSTLYNFFSNEKEFPLRGHSEALSDP